MHKKWTECTEWIEVNQNGSKLTKWTKLTKLNQMKFLDEIEPNGANRTKVD